MSYIDGIVVPVKKKELRAYRRLAELAAKTWRKCGALEYREAVADDTPVGKVTSFPRSLKLKRGEIAVFSYIVYKSRAHRDRVNARVLKDPVMEKLMKKKTMPFDMHRMFWGGFESIVHVRAR